MKPLHDLICQLQKIGNELAQALKEECDRKATPHPKPRMPGLDLSGFDLNHFSTRSQLLHEPALPPYIPSEDRFSRLIKDLLIDIKAARVYLQHDAYPFAKAWGERISRFKQATELLEKLSENALAQESYYIDVRFIPDNSEEYCWDCADRFIKRTHLVLIYSCLLLSRKQSRLAYTLWDLCDRADWWTAATLWSHVRPYRYWRDESDGVEVCDSCYTLLSYSLSQDGVDEECDRFLEYGDEMTPEDWWQLHAVFQGAEECDYPNYIATKLDALIDKYELCPRSSVADEKESLGIVAGAIRRSHSIAQGSES